MDAEVLNDSVEHLLHDLHLIDDTTGLLKRAAVLLFHPDPEKYISGAYIKIGFFRTTDDDLAFQDEIHEPLMLQIDRTIDLLTTKYLTYAITYEGFSRQEKTAFPASALRETLLNAIAHKDYADAAPIQVSVYSDHVVFWNAGQLPDNWTIENLLQNIPHVPITLTSPMLFSVVATSRRGGEVSGKSSSPPSNKNNFRRKLIIIPVSCSPFMLILVPSFPPRVWMIILLKSFNTSFKMEASRILKFNPS